MRQPAPLRRLWRGNVAGLNRQGGSCGTSLPAMSSCSIIVRFAPASASSKMASLNIGTGVTPASLTGTGVAAASAITNLDRQRHARRQDLDPHGGRLEELRDGRDASSD